MFDYSKMIQRAVQFFPTWSDIRKRYKTSTGGKLIGSILEETCELENAIKEYKKYFFLDNYEGCEDDVIAYVYKFSIGNVNIKNLHIKYENNTVKITEDIGKLNTHDIIAYYESGYIYFNDKIKPSKVRIYVDNSELKQNYELISVWNIFDEFACFVDIQRHPNESNSDLVKRILYRTRHKPNSSVEGLQDGIISELMVDFPDITKDEIKIETVNDTNLRQSYKNFNSLLDFLNSINCDVYRWKRWDINSWTHDFKSIDYIPAVWDESISNFKNGIGYGDDCKVSIAGNTQQTNATITLYKKAKETMKKYLSNKKLEKDITFQLKRYNDILNSNNINYTIQAAKLARLYPEQIKMKIYKETNDVSEVSIDRVFKFCHNVTTDKKDMVIEDAYPYRLKFEPSDNQDIEIKTCTITYVNYTTKKPEKVIDLLKNKTGFKVNSLGSLVSNSIKNSITKVEDFDIKKCVNLKNLDNNKGIQMIGSTGTGVKTLYNFGGQSISYDATCEPTQITKDMNFIYLDSAHGVWNDNNIKFYPNDLNKKVVIKITANEFSFDVLTNNTVNVMVRYSNKGNYNVIEKASYGSSWKTKTFKTPQYMEIVISTNSNEEVSIGNFKYCNYNIKFQYKINDDDYRDLIDNTLPLNNNISLKVIISSSSASNPIIRGIYIGSNITNSTYVTDSFGPMNNTYREIEIVSNAKVTLIKRDIFDSKDMLYTENFDPTVSYIAKENDAYIRLDLSDYSSINSINTKIGQIQKIEESGNTYYNLLLTKGQEIKRITIDGIRNKTSYDLTLLDMINKKLKSPFQITIDRLYCSMLSKELIVIRNSNNGQSEKVLIDSSLFYGIDGTKYEFIDLPDDIEVIWGIGEKAYSSISYSSFNYISFYEKKSVIHTANNSYNLLVNEMRDVKVAENFTDPNLYDKKSLYYYTVTSNTNDVGVRFYNYLDENEKFDNLLDWCIGLKNLYIKSTNDFANESIYNVSTLDYTDKYVLNEYIELEDSYTINNNNTIYTEQYIIIPPKGMTVKYKEYDATSNTEDLIRTEIITVNGAMFKKLQYSNIDKILDIQLKTRDGKTINNVKYTLLNDEGIIVWNESLEVDSTITITYIIRKPVSLVFDLDMLYNLTGYTVESYKKINSYYLPDMKNGSVYDLRNLKDYNDSNLAYIQCEEPSFEGQMINDHFVKFNKHAQEKTVLVKTGYYYINGLEYYMFSEEGEKKLKNNQYISYENVDVYDEYLYTYKNSNNYVRNSEMLTRNINDLYTYDCNIPISSPKYNKYTACDSYNGWTTFNSTLSLTDELYLKKISGEIEYEGFNNVALKIIPNTSNCINYAYIDITEYISKTTYISLASTNKLNIYIGEEFKLGNLNPKTALSIIPIQEIKPLYNSCIRTCKLNTKDNTRYYLIIVGAGIIDDIVISDELKSIANYHVKNIEKIGFYFNETKTEGTIYKMKLNDNFNSICNGASLCSDKYIRMVGNVSWNATKIKTYSTMDDFLNPNCYKDTEMIVGDYIKAPETTSCRFVTDYVEIDPKIINRLFIKVNDVLIDNMNDFKITLFGTSDKKRTPSKIMTTHNNYAFEYGNNLPRFVKAQIEIPENYVVDKIEFLAEYKSDKNNAPVVNVPNVGNIISPVYDLQESLIYGVKNINIDDISNINDVDVYIRAMSEDNTSGIWSSWNKLDLIMLDDKITYDTNNLKRLSFINTPMRYFQFKIVLKSQSAYVKLNSIDIEVINN